MGHETGRLVKLREGMPMKGFTYDAGAAAYDRFTGRWSVAFGSSLLAAAGVTVGEKVLEVAAGTGALAVMAAAQVGVSGRVVAADLSLPMLRVAKTKIAGLPVDPVVMDGQDVACRDRSFDVVICQLGVMFFPDAKRGVQEFRRVLRQEGRLAVQVWSWPDRVSFFGVLADALSRYLPDHRDALYSPAALADPDRLERLLAAGFRNVSVVAETREVAFESFEEYWSGIEAGGGRLGQFYLDLGDRERRAVRDEVSRRMAQFQSDGRLILRAEALIAVGINRDS
jgi:ubiquinone/menaquinone biosynthesis C-methylase UbiE